MIKWNRPAEELNIEEHTITSPYARDVTLGRPIPLHRDYLLQFKLALNQNICIKLEADEMAFNEMLINGEIIEEIDDVVLSDLISRVYRHYEMSPHSAIVGHLVGDDVEARVLIYKGKAGVAIVSSVDTRSCVDVIDMYLNVRGAGIVAIVPGDIASSILQ